MLTNCTPHDVVIVGNDNEELVRYPASGVVVRATSAPQLLLGARDGVPVVSKPSYEGVTGLPGRGDIIVSIVAGDGAVACAAPGQRVYVPDTGPGAVVRYPDGTIRGTRRLILWGVGTDSAGDNDLACLLRKALDDELREGPPLVLPSWIHPEDIEEKLRELVKVDVCDRLRPSPLR